MDHSGKFSEWLSRPSIPELPGGAVETMLPCRYATAALLALAAGLAAVFHHLGSQPDLKTHVPEFTALMLLAGAVYIAGVYIVWHTPLGPSALLIIISGAVVFRLFLLPVSPQLSDDVYRYQWEGRIQRAHINPYMAFPAAAGLQQFQDPAHPITAGEYTPTAYPPLSEMTFSWLGTVPAYKKLFTALDLGSIALLLVSLGAVEQPAQRVLAYAWNPTAVVSFAMCGHLDSLAIFTLLAATLLIIARRPVLSGALLAVSVLSKFFAILFLPIFYKVLEAENWTPAAGAHATLGPRPGRADAAFRVAGSGLRRRRMAFGAAFLGILLAGYAPYLGSRGRVLQGLLNYAAVWEANDSIFRLLRKAGNSQLQAELVSGVALLVLVVYAVKSASKIAGGTSVTAAGSRPNAPCVFLLRAALILMAGLLLLSPDAFPWYFTWSIPFLCFCPSAPWLLMSITCVLGYAPVVAYAAGQPYVHAPFILILEYGPVIVWLGLMVVRRVARTERSLS
jgi:hypothetical protein